MGKLNIKKAEKYFKKHPATKITSAVSKDAKLTGSITGENLVDEKKTKEGGSEKEV